MLAANQAEVNMLDDGQAACACMSLFRQQQLLRRFWWFLVVQTAVLSWGTAETAVAIPRQGFGVHVPHPFRAMLLLWATFTCCLLMLVTASLLVFNLYLAAKGLTLYEFMRFGRQIRNVQGEEGDLEAAEYTKWRPCAREATNLRRFFFPVAG